MKNKNLDQAIILLKWLIAAIFIIAGVGKILDPATFANDIDNYRILPYFLVTIAAIVLPWLETLCGLSLIFSKLNKGSTFIIFILTIIFSIAISSALARGLDISCGCFSIDGEGTKIGFTKLIQDVVLLAAIGVVYFNDLKKMGS